MRPLRLESPAALPARIASRLAEHEGLFRQHEFLESVLKSDAVRNLVAELRDYLRQQRIHGYHCTKEPVPGFFAARGLRLTDVRAHQEEFLDTYGERFTESELKRIEAAWDGYFVRGGQVRDRNGCIWTCLSRSLVKTSGTETFFRFFGGEAIFMPLRHDAPVASKLQAIGQPVVVEVSLPGDGLTARYSMELAVLSQYHRTIRPDAYPYQAEAQMNQAVPAKDVICVTPLHEFQP